MGWMLTEDAEAFHSEAAAVLAADPGAHSVLLTVLETVRRHGRHAYAEGVPWFGTWRDPAGGAAVALATPPYPVALGSMPPIAAAELAGALRESGRRTSGVRGEREAATAFATAWCGLATGWRVARDERRYLLAELVPPDRPVPGRARHAGPAYRALLLTWFAAFLAETQSPVGRDVTGMVDQRLAAGLVTLWEDGGEPVAMAGRSALLAGMVRVGPVYTPPEHRRRGYAAAVTHAVSAAALDGGAEQVLLYTDLANPTSNGVYQRLGYRAVADEVSLAFDAD